MNRVKTPPQRGISHLGDHGSSIFVASASEWSVSVRGQTEEYTRGEGSDRVVLHLGEKNSKQPEVQTPRVIPKDCPRRGQEIALVSSRRAVTTLRNNENSVRLVRQRAHVPIYGFFSGIYGNRWQIRVAKYKIPEARNALCTRVSLSLFHFPVCRASDSRKLAPFATRSRSSSA